MSESLPSVGRQGTSLQTQSPERLVGEMWSPFPTPTGMDDITAEWLTAVLGDPFRGRVTAVEARRIGTGQVSTSVRLGLTWDPDGAGPASLVAKVPSDNEVSLQAARMSRTYEVEVGFFQDLAPTLPVNVPTCYYADHNPATEAYALLFADMAPAEQGDQMAGCSVEEAGLALDELALLHGPRWRDPTLKEIGWLNRHDSERGAHTRSLMEVLLPGFLERYAERLSPDVVELTKRFAPRVADWLGQGDRFQTVTHGDFRVDNLLFGGGRVCVLDWQVAAMGQAAADVAYFLGGSFQPEVRREHEERLVRRYHERLAAAGGDIAWDELWRDYRRFAFSGLLMAVVASMIVERTDRGDDMFMAMAERGGRHALDLDAESLLGS
jgi:Ecdysteroid kinase-like family